MRASVIFILLPAMSLAAVPMSAEVIHLKNGRTIWAEQVRESGNRLEYDLGNKK